jgi:hypothetical protein
VAPREDRTTAGGTSGREHIFTRILNAAWLRPVILLLLLFWGWDLAIRVFQVPPCQIPAPRSVLETLWREWPTLLAEAWPTTVATVERFVLSAVFGIAMAVLSPAPARSRAMCIRCPFSPGPSPRSRSRRILDVIERLAVPWHVSQRQDFFIAS